MVESQKDGRVIPKKIEKLVVTRFAGSSIGSPEVIKAVAKHLKEKQERGSKIVVLVSAIPREWEESLNFAQAVNQQAAGKFLNSLIGACDFKSTPLLAMALEKIGISTYIYNGGPVAIKPKQDEKVGYEFNVDNKVAAIFKLMLEKNKVIVCSGFKVIEGEDKINSAILRDSNASAVLLAGWLDADVCEIYTSRDGIFQVDPLVVPNAKRIDFLTYSQMRCFSHLGARILSRRCVDLATSLGVIVKVQLSPALGKSSGGTIIGPVKPENSAEEIEGGLAIQPNVVQLKFVLPQKLDIKQLFNSLADICLIDSGFIQVGESYLIVTEEDCEEVIKKMNRFKKINVKKEEGFSSLSLIDWRMVDTSGYIGKIIQALDRLLVRLNSAGDSITVVVKKENLEKAANKLAETFGMVS